MIPRSLYSRPTGKSDYKGFFYAVGLEFYLHISNLIADKINLRSKLVLNKEIRAHLTVLGTVVIDSLSTLKLVELPAETLNALTATLISRIAIVRENINPFFDTGNSINNLESVRERQKSLDSNILNIKKIFTEYFKKLSIDLNLNLDLKLKFWTKLANRFPKVRNKIPDETSYRDTAHGVELLLDCLRPHFMLPHGYLILYVLPDNLGPINELPFQLLQKVKEELEDLSNLDSSPAINKYTEIMADISNLEDDAPDLEVDYTPDLEGIEELIQKLSDPTIKNLSQILLFLASNMIALDVEDKTYVDKTPEIQVDQEDRHYTLADHIREGALGDLYRNLYDYHSEPDDIIVNLKNSICVFMSEQFNAYQDQKDKIIIELMSEFYVKICRGYLNLGKIIGINEPKDKVEKVFSELNTLFADLEKLHEKMRARINQLHNITLRLQWSIMQFLPQLPKNIGEELQTLINDVDQILVMHKHISIFMTDPNAVFSQVSQLPDNFKKQFSEMSECFDDILKFQDEFEKRLKSDWKSINDTDEESYNSKILEMYNLSEHFNKVTSGIITSLLPTDKCVHLYTFIFDMTFMLIQKVRIGYVNHANRLTELRKIEEEQNSMEEEQGSQSILQTKSFNFILEKFPIMESYSESEIDEDEEFDEEDELFDTLNIDPTYFSGILLTLAKDNESIRKDIFEAILDKIKINRWSIETLTIYPSLKPRLFLEEHNKNLSLELLTNSNIAYKMFDLGMSYQDCNDSLFDAIAGAMTVFGFKVSAKLLQIACYNHLENILKSENEKIFSNDIFTAIQTYGLKINNLNSVEEFIKNLLEPKSETLNCIPEIILPIITQIFNLRIHWVQIKTEIEKVDNQEKENVKMYQYLSSENGLHPAQNFELGPRFQPIIHILSCADQWVPLLYRDSEKEMTKKEKEIFDSMQKENSQCSQLMMPIIKAYFESIANLESVPDIVSLRIYAEHHNMSIVIHSGAEENGQYLIENKIKINSSQLDVTPLHLFYDLKNDIWKEISEDALILNPNKLEEGEYARLKM